jgi:hypothetical protein
MANELILICILWSLTLVAFIGAINSRGHVRATLSYVFAFLVLLLASFVTFRITIELINAPPPAPIIMEIPVEPEPKVDTELVSYKTEVARIIAEAAALATNIQSFNTNNLLAISDSEYERLMGQANQLRNRSNGLSRQIRALNAPAKYSEPHSQLLRAGENLTTAGDRLSAFFNAENATQEADIRSQYQRFGALANSQFNALRNLF